MKKIVNLLGLLPLMLAGCQHYLDVRPDKKMIVPKSLADCRALLDDYGSMNTGYPALGEGASDNIFLKSEDWKSLASPQERAIYDWGDVTPMVNNWQNPYRTIFNANLVLQVLEGAGDNAEGRMLMGEALFFRAYAFHCLAIHFVPPFQASASARAGLPLRLTPDIDAESMRSTVGETYGRIIDDLGEALALLPDASQLASQPDRQAALAMLARVYLSMGEYGLAGRYANECLGSGYSLIDYNALGLTSTTPVPRFNDEVIFQSTSLSTGVLGTSICRVDTALYRSYGEHDLRKRAFFRLDGNGHPTFKANYDSRFNSTMFTGLTTAEMLLVRAEANARDGRAEAAVEDLNALMANRWDNSVAFEPLVADGALQALRLVLEERRKELLFRGLRWSDIRRLNQEESHRVTLRRQLDGDARVLLPLDPRFTFLIPDEVIVRTKMLQNER